MVFPVARTIHKFVVLLRGQTQSCSALSLHHEVYDSIERPGRQLGKAERVASRLDMLDMRSINAGSGQREDRPCGVR